MLKAAEQADYNFHVAFSEEILGNWILSLILIPMKPYTFLIMESTSLILWETCVFITRLIPVKPVCKAPFT